MRELWQLRAAALLVVVVVAAAAVPVRAQQSGGLGGANVSAQSAGYGDVDPSSTHAGNIGFLADEGIFVDTECDTGFCPRDALERWVMAVWLVRILDGRDPSRRQTRFADVDADSWWAAHTERLAELGVTLGCVTEPARFCPDDTVTRAQMASFLVRAFELSEAQSAGFSDVPAGSAHRSSIDALTAAGVTVGCDTNPRQYCPGQRVTRAQMASFVQRSIETTTTRLLTVGLARFAGWLDRVNAYRAASGLSEVVETPEWSDGIRKHLEYLKHTPSSLRTGAYANAHYENPESPYYTKEGAAAGLSSNLGHRRTTDAGSIDRWMTTPFHAIGILRPSLRSVAFGSIDSGGLSTGLDVIRGLERSSLGSTERQVILFPGPDSSVHLTNAGGELPNPLESCPGYRYGTAGLPLIIMLPDRPEPSATAQLVGPGDTRYSTDDGSLCRVDEHTYISTNTVYGPTGLSILGGNNAVFLIAKRRLTPGRWHVTYSSTETGEQITWSFSIRA